MSDQPNFIFQGKEPGLNNLPHGKAVSILGLVSLAGAFCYGLPGIICGVIGLVLGNKDRALYKAAPDFYSPAGYKTSKQGRKCAVIGLSLGSVILITIVIYLIVSDKISFGHLKHYGK